MNAKLIAIGLVAILLVAGVAVVVATNGNNDQKKEEKKGLYALDATVLDIDMGGMTNTPKMVETMEYMYKEVYGDLVSGADKLTLSDAKKNTAFWDKYAGYKPISKINDDGSVTYSTKTDAGTADVTIPGPADSMVFSYTAYALTYYYLLCIKYNMTPFSDAAKNNKDLVSEYSGCVVAGLNKDALKDSTPELCDYLSKDYVELGGSLKNFDDEKLGKAIKDASTKELKVMLVGSGSLNADNYVKYKAISDAQGGYGLLFSNASTTIATFAAIKQTGMVFGLNDEADKLIEDMQLRMYKVYYSAMEKNKTVSHKAYFEGSTGKSTSKTGSGCSLCEFMGWDTSLFTGAEIDTETLLLEKPDVMMYYTNDDRSMDVKMRVTS